VSLLLSNENKSVTLLDCIMMISSLRCFRKAQSKLFLNSFARLNVDGYYLIPKLNITLKSSSYCRNTSSCIKCKYFSKNVSSHHHKSSRCISSYKAKDVVDAAPQAIQPYLRLMRIDRPIGKTCPACSVCTICTFYTVCITNVLSFESFCLSFCVMATNNVFKKLCIT